MCPLSLRTDLWRALISWGFLAEHHRCKHKPERHQWEWLVSSIAAICGCGFWENISILLSIIIHQREGEASCFKERKKINLYFNLDVNWSGGRRTSWYQARESPPALSLGLQWDRSSSSLNQQDKYPLWHPLYHQIISLVNIFSIIRSSL